MADHHKDHEILELQVKALKDLIEVAKAVVSTLDLDTVLRAILTSAMNYAEVPAGSIALFNEQTKELTLHAHSGLTVDFVKQDRWKLSDGGLTEKVLSSATVLYVEDTAATPFAQNPGLLREGIRSLICLPLMLQQRVVGILYLDDFRPRTFDRERMDLLSILASFAAMAIDNAKLHNRTKLMAITDSLTGLYNHRYFQQIFAKELERARRYNKPLSIIMMDVDNFKKFNDTYGHPNGDKILAAIGRIVTDALRSADCPVRYGGEEFIVLLPETALENALLVAERLRSKIARGALEGLANIPVDSITVSIGAASYPKDGENCEELLERVDEFLYQAKMQGKNRVTCRGGASFDAAS